MAKDKIGSNAGQWYVEVGKLESGKQPRFYLGRMDDVSEDAARLRRARVRAFWQRFTQHNVLNGWPVKNAEPFQFWSDRGIDFAKQIGKGATRLVYDVPGTDEMTLDALAELNRHYDGLVVFMAADHRRERVCAIGDTLHATVTNARKTTHEVDAGVTVHDWLDKFAEYAKTTKVTFDEDTNANETSEWGYNLARQIGFLKAGVKNLPLALLDGRAIEAVVIHYANRPVSVKTGKPIAVKYASSLLKVWRQFLRWTPKQTDWKKPEDWEDAFTQHRPKKNNVEKAAKAIGRVKSYRVEQLHTIYQYATPSERILFLLALNCGFGAIEISGLRVRDIQISRSGDSFIKHVRMKTEDGVYGEHWLYPQTVEALEWSRSRAAAVLGHPLLVTDRVVLRKNGEHLVKLTAVGNRSNKAANMWAKLTERVQQDNPDFPKLSFGKMRKTAGNMIKMFSDDVTVAVFHQRSSAVEADDEAEVYTDRDYQKVFTAQQNVYDLLKPMFDSVPQPFDDAKKMYTGRKTLDRIAKLWAEGVKPQQIANMTGTSRATVYRHRPVVATAADDVR